MDAVADSWPGRLLSTSGGPVFVRHQPAAEPDGDSEGDAGLGAAAGRPLALFVHGLGGESLDWADVVVALGDRLDAYAVDLPGFGFSPMPADGDLSLDAHARAVVETILAILGAGAAPDQAAPAGAVHLVANSLGGTVATRVAAEHPELVRSLVLLSPALPDLRPRFSSAQLTIALVPILGRRLVTLALRGDPERVARRIYALCYGDPAGVSPRRHADELAALRRRAQLPHSDLVYRESLRALVSSYFDRGPRQLWKQAALVGVPTLLIYGGRDRLVHPRMAAKAQRTFPDAEVVRLPRAGHVAQLEHPADVAAALRGFLERRGPGVGMAARRGTVVSSDARVNGAPPGSTFPPLTSRL